MTDLETMNMRVSFFGVTALLLPIAQEVHAGEGPARLAWARSYDPVLIGGTILGGPLASQSSGATAFAGLVHGTLDLDLSDGVDMRPQGLFATKWSSSGDYEWTYSINAREVYPNQLAWDGEGNLWIAGGFEGTVDFDPGPGTDIHEAPPHPYKFNLFLTKLRPDGGYDRTLSLQTGLGFVHAQGVALDDLGNIFLCGGYSGTVDFDPGPGTYELTGRTDLYVTKLNSDLEHVWTRGFGGSSNDSAMDVLVDHQGDVLVRGQFRFGADFDPGPGVDWHVGPSFNLESGSLSKFRGDGTYLWTHVWPALGGMAVDGSDHVYAASNLWEEVSYDADPSGGIEAYTGPVGLLSKFRPDGSYLWTRALQGRGGRVTLVAVVVDANDNVYVAGTFSSEIDLDPGAAEDLHDTGFYLRFGAFVAKLSSDGEFLWSRVWTGGNSYVLFEHMAIDALGNLFIRGGYRMEVDLDPACPVDPHTESFGGYIPFILKMSPTVPGADFDGDGSVGLADVAAFQNCFEGEAGESCSQGCALFDLIPDNALDLIDFVALQDLLTGPQ